MGHQNVGLISSSIFFNLLNKFIASNRSMSKSRVSDLTQKSPKLLVERKVPSYQQKTSSLSAEKSPRLKDRRSPRGSQSDPVTQKKLGTRIAGLESQLEQAQEELKMLKDQLASAEAAKKEAQQELEKKTTKTKTEVRQELEKKTTKPKKEVQPKLEKKSTKAVTPEPEEVFENCSHPSEVKEFVKTDGPVQENVHDDQLETDVFEVQVEKATVEAKVDLSQPTEIDELDSKLVCRTTESPVVEQEKPIINELTVKNDEIISLTANMELKEKKLQVVNQENENLKLKLNDLTAEVLSTRVKEEEMTLRLKQFEEELETSKATVAKLNEKLGAAEGARDTLETEIKKLSVQTEQWRKAADAAAAVLAGDVNMNGRRISERCGSMDKHYFEPGVGGYAGFVGSPGLGGDDSDDGYGNGKRKGSSIRKFGDLWKKKGQK